VAGTGRILVSLLGFASGGFLSSCSVPARRERSFPSTSQLMMRKEALQMTEHDILGRVRLLVDQEHELRTKRSSGEIDQGQEQAQLKALEEALDQCWDLLRQRRARTEFGENPEDVAARPVKTVEGYLQ